MPKRTCSTSALRRYSMHFWRDGWLTWRGWLLIFIFVAFGSVCAFGPRWWPPSASAYCDALIERGFVRDCIKDPSPPAGATSSRQFTIVRSGKIGRVTRFSDSHSYWQEFNRWKALDVTRDAMLLGFGRALVLAFVPGPFDVVERRDFTHFQTEDMEAVFFGHPPNWLGTREHPIHTDACLHAPECAEEGRCAIRPSHPDECIAGFDKDCMASTQCRTKQLCHAIDDHPFTCGF